MDDLNQSRDLPHNYGLTPDRALPFNVCFVLVIEDFGRLQMYLSAAKYFVKNITNKLIQNLCDKQSFVMINDEAY